MRRVLLTAAAAILLAPATPAAAAPGDLDSTFGSGGKVTTPIGSGSAVANGVAVQADGKLVAAGSSTGGFTLARYILDGSLHTTFHAMAVVSTPDFSAATAILVEVQADGKRVAAAYDNSGIS